MQEKVKKLKKKTGNDLDFYYLSKDNNLSLIHIQMCIRDSLSTAVAKEITKNLNGISKGFKNEEIQNFLRKMINRCV